MASLYVICAVFGMYMAFASHKFIYRPDHHTVSSISKLAINGV